MTKILFLDFDGVLNDYAYNSTENFSSNDECYKQKKSTKNFIFQNLKSNDTHKLWALSDLDYHRVKLLNQIVHHTNCKIVFSTSWRSDGVNNLTLYLAIMGFMYPENCIDCTGFGFDGVRGLQISQWLRDNITEQECANMRYAILDDEMFDIKDYHSDEVLFQTNGKVSGLTEEVVDRVVEWLNREGK